MSDPTADWRVVCDLASEKGCRLAIEAAESPRGGLDIPICNHGLGSAHETVLREQPPGRVR